MECIEKKILHCRSLRRRGKYGAATNVLRGITPTSSGGKDLVLLELSETLLCQGYYKKALDCIESRLGLLCNELSDDQLQSHTVLLALRMLGSCLTCIVRGKFRVSIAAAQQIWENMGAADMHIVGERAQILIAIYYCKTLHLAGNINRIQVYQGRAFETKPVLRAFFQLFQTLEDMETCFEIAICCVNTFGWDQEDQLKAILDGHEKVSQLVQAKTRAFMAFSLPGQLSEQAIELCKLAQPVLYAEHAHDGLDLEIRRDCLLLAQPRSDFEAGISKLSAYIATYENIDYPAGRYDTYLKLLDIARARYMFDLQFQVLKECRTLVAVTGSDLLLVQIELQTLGHWHIYGALNGMVYEAAQAMYDKLTDYECLYVRGNIAYFAAGAALRQSKATEAFEWAKKNLLLWKDCGKESKALAQLQFMTTKAALPGDFTEAEHFVCEGFAMIEEDIVNEQYDTALTKASIMLRYILSRIVMEEDRKREHIGRLFEKIDEVLERGVQSLSPVSRAAVLSDKAVYALHLGSFSPDTSFEEEAMACEEEAIKIYRQNDKSRFLVELAICRQKSGVACYQAIKKLIRQEDRSARDALATALKVFMASQAAYEVVGSIGDLTDNLYWIALVRYTSWSCRWCRAEDVLQAFAQYYKTMEERRNAIPAVKEVVGIKAKQRLSSNAHVLEIIRFALQVCRSENLDVDLWNWVQRTKARSLSDTLGLDMIVPKALMDRIEQSKQARDLYQKEARIVAALASAEPLARLDLRTELNEHRHSMHKNEALHEFLSLRDGSPIEMSNLIAAFETDLSTFGRYNVVLIDWFFKGEELFTISLRKGDDGTMKTQCFRINADSRGLRIWTANNLRSPKNSTDVLNFLVNQGHRPLKILDPLIEWIALQSEPEDLLILCPSDWIHTVPLHALHIPNSDTPLIARNPIVYNASITTFGQCCRRAFSSPSTPAVRNSSFFAVYEPIPGDPFPFDRKEQDHLYKNTETLAQNFHATHLCGEQATAEAFCERLQQAHLLHFHGHCETAASIVDQSLRLFNTSTTVGQIFDMSLQAPHISLLACGSSMQEVNQGDEPLGLVTALLCAGASSVLGTLWPVSSKAARKFSKHFYRTLFGVTDGNGVADLAAAVRQAALQLRDSSSTSKPLHWAPFVLHGSWFMRSVRSA